MGPLFAAAKLQNDQNIIKIGKISKTFVHFEKKNNFKSDKTIMFY